MSKKNPSKRQELTQSENQQLLAILRKELYIVTHEKNDAKKDAAYLWQQCDRELKLETAKEFAGFSYWRAEFKKTNKQQKTLVNLITKLKAQR